LLPPSLFFEIRMLAIISTTLRIISMVLPFMNHLLNSVWNQNGTSS
jgi:hypothetical protein